MEFLMQNTATSGHPLHITGANNPAFTGRVTMFNFTVVHNGHCFKSTMWVLPDTTPLLRRGEIHQAGIVQQQERAELFAMTLV